MKTFEALLKKEFRVKRKADALKYVLCFVFILYFSLILIMVLKDPALNETIRESNMSFFKTLPLLAAVMCCYFMNIYSNPIKQDINSGWNIYSYALPIKPLQRGSALFFHDFILSLSGIIITLLYAGVVSLVINEPLSADVPCYAFLITAAVILINASNHFFVLKARNKLEMDKYKTCGNISMIVTAFVFITVFMKANKISLTSVLFGDGNASGISFPEFRFPDLLWTIAVFMAAEATVFYLYLRCSAHAYAKHGAYAGSHAERKEKPAEAGYVQLKKNSPKGFMYFELSMNKAEIAIVFFLPLFCSLLPFIASMFEIKKGNMSIVRMFEIANSPPVLIAMYILGFLGVSMVISSTFGSESKKMWACFVASTPGGINEYLRNKYLFCFILNVIYHISFFLTNRLLYVITRSVTGKEIQTNTGIYLIGVFFLLYFCALDIPIIIRFGAKKASIIKVIVLLTIAIAFTFIFSYLPEEKQVRLMEAIANPLSIKELGKDMLRLIKVVFSAVAAALYLLSIKLSVNLYLKGAGNDD